MQEYFPNAFWQVQLLREKCLDFLAGIPEIFRKNGRYELGPYVCEINDGCIDFWRSGNEKNKRARLTPPGKMSNTESSLVVFKPGHRTVISNFAGIRIEEYFGENGRYPHTQFEWAGWEAKGLKRGDLYFVRVDLSGRNFVNYDQYDGFQGKYHDYPNPVTAPEKAPLSLKDGDEFFGQRVRMHVDFDVRAQEILDESELVEFVSACKTCSVKD